MMSRFSQPSPASRGTAPERILGVLYRSLRVALTERCARTHGTQITLSRVNNPGEDEAVLPFQVDCQGPLQLSGRLTVEPLGDGTYDVHCRVADVSSRRFTFSQPSRGGDRLSYAPVLGQKLADFLLEELKKHLGDRLLREMEEP